MTVPARSSFSPLPVLREIVIYPARVIVTLDPSRPDVGAVAVVGDRMVATVSSQT